MLLDQLTNQNCIKQDIAEGINLPSTILFD